MSHLDATLKDLIQNDKLQFEADPAIKLRLMNHLQAKIGSSFPRQNMIMPFFTGFLSAKLIGLKVGVIASVLIAFIGFKQMNNQSNKTILTDTCSVFEKNDTVGLLKGIDSTSFN